MKTKDRILAVALELFNQQSTSAVSTNHIAEAAGISPGNLYYYYRNKEEIIRALFEQLFALWDVAFDLPADEAPTLATVRQLIRTNFNIMADYRFVYREIIALLQQDATLKQRYIEVRQRGYIGFHQIIAALADGGVLQGALDDASTQCLADLCWLISEFWLSTVEVSGYQPDEAQMERGIELMMQVLRPYLTA